VCNDFKAIRKVMDGFDLGSRSIKEQAKRLETDVQKMGVNLNKLYTHYKSNLGSNNNRMLVIELQIAGSVNDPRTQRQEGDFEFSQHASAPTQHSLLQMELQEMREDIAELKRAQTLHHAAPPITHPI
jgi:hypothetical protein